MEIPPEISYRDVDPDEDDRTYVQERIDKLNRFCDHITSCSVSLEREQSGAETGDTFRARVRVHVPPHHEVVGEHNAGDTRGKLDVRGAASDAFDNVERQLRRLNDKQNRKRP